MNRKILLALTFCCLVLATLAWTIDPAEDAMINQIEAKTMHGMDYIDINADQDISPSGLLTDSELTIEIPRARLAPDYQPIKRKCRYLSGFSAQQSGNKVILTLYTTKEIDYEIVNTFGRNRSVVEIRNPIDETAKIMAAWEAVSLKLKPDALEPEEYVPDQASGDTSLKGKVIVVDPGHGGLDPGSQTRSGVLEKHLTLAAAKKLARHLSNAGAKVFLTRKGDRTTSLRDITAFANSKQADLFICLHFNYLGQEKAAGIETYYYNKNSRRLALALHQTLVSTSGRKDRGLRRAMFYTIHHTNMPAVLLEPAYMSNHQEEKLILDSGWQDNLALNITKGVKRYFRTKLY